MDSVCPYCKGSLFINVGYKEKIVNGRKTIYPYAQPCHCQANKKIGKRFGVLSTLPDAIPEDSQKVREVFTTDGVARNILFFGDEGTFLYILKSYMLHDFFYRNYMLLEGGNIVEIYNVPRKDDWLTIQCLNQYDLLALLFTTTSGYESVKSCVADVVKNRLRLTVPTWIYCRSEDTLKSCKEYSPDLEQYLDKFTRIAVGDNIHLKGYTRQGSLKLKAKKERDINDLLGRKGGKI